MSYYTDSVVFGDTQIKKTLLDTSSQYSWVPGNDCKLETSPNQPTEMACAENTFNCNDRKNGHFKCQDATNAKVFKSTLNQWLPDQYINTGGVSLVKPTAITGFPVQAAMSLTKKNFEGLPAMNSPKTIVTANDANFFQANGIINSQLLNADAVLSLSNNNEFNMLNLVEK